MVVDVKKKLQDVYDYTDEDGEQEANEQIRKINEQNSDKQAPWLPLDTAMLNLLAQTGRAKPFTVASTPWIERFTAELRLIRPAARGLAAPMQLQIVPDTGSWQRPRTQNP